MTDQWGVLASYLDGQDVEQFIAAETIEQLRGLIGQAPSDLERTAPIVSRPGGSVNVSGEVTLENGGSLRLGAMVPPDCPLGYHTLRTDEGVERRLIISPGRCQLPAGRQWGWSVQLYAARSAESWGIGDLADLQTLRTWTARQSGSFLMVNPLHAVAPGLPQQPSPYSPATRRFRNPIYLAVEQIPGAGKVELGKLASRGRALNQAPVIERDEVWPVKRAALELIFQAQPPGADFRRWRHDSGPGLAEFATWCALADRYGANWHEWPAELQNPAGAAVSQFQADAAAEIEFHAWLQWLLFLQLPQPDSGISVVQDLPIGVDPNGADAWAWQELLADGVSIGAPPDSFNAGGQDWGMPPFIPWRLRAANYQPFIDSIRATITGGGGLRIDHIIGLSRLWWIPRGEQATAGGYVSYPLDDLLDIICLESVRAGAVVVGEDLGTVEESVRQAMQERNILSSKVFWFETDEPASWPELAMASVSTHDLPTVSGLWSGTDSADQAAHGVEVPDSAREEMLRLLTDAGADPDDDDASVVAKTYTALAEAGCLLLTASLDDALAVRDRPNIPGSSGRSNWCLPLPVELAELVNRPLPDRLADILTRSLRTAQPANGTA